jgi:hypothetical protein
VAAVQGWINNPATNFGFVIQDYANANKDDLVFSSKEAAVVNRPKLQMVYDPPAPASLATTQTAAALMAPTQPDGNLATASTRQADLAREQAYASLAGPQAERQVKPSYASTHSQYAPHLAKSLNPATPRPSSPSATLDTAFAEILSLR